MDTKVEGGVVQPRFYIPYGDEIRSKYAMEAIAVPHGIGPVIGFDRVSVSTSGFTITGTNVEIGNWDNTNISDAAIAELKKRIYSAGGFRTCYISRDNLSGRVVNSHITPDGMLFIDPTTLEFTDNEFKIDPSTLGNGSNNFLVALKATHTWVGSKEETPQMSTFTIKRFGFTRKLKELLRMPFPQVLKMLADNGFGIDNNTEVLVGLYLFGTASEDNDPHVTSLMEAVGYILPIIPYTYEWPAKFNYSLGTELTLYEYMDAKVAKFTELTDGLYQRVTGVENKFPIQKNDGSIANGALTPNLLEANFDLPNGTTATTQPSSATQGNLVATLDYVKGAVGNIVFPEAAKPPYPYSAGYVYLAGTITYQKLRGDKDILCGGIDFSGMEEDANFSDDEYFIYKMIYENPWDTKSNYIQGPSKNSIAVTSTVQVRPPGTNFGLEVLDKSAQISLSGGYVYINKDGRVPNIGLANIAQSLRIVTNPSDSIGNCLIAYIDFTWVPVIGQEPIITGAFTVPTNLEFYITFNLSFFLRKTRKV